MSRRLSHESTHDLLPWYVTGTLAAEERRRVEDHVKSCLMCHHELLKERELHTLMQMNPAGDIAAEQGYDRLSSRLNGHLPPRTRGPGNGFVGAASCLRDRWPLLAAPLRLSVAVAAVVAVVGALSWQMLPRTLVPGPAPAPYITLTSDPSSATYGIDLVFAADVSENERRALIGEIDGTIVSGPTSIGRYRIRLDERDIDAAGARSKSAVVRNTKEH